MSRLTFSPVQLGHYDVLQGSHGGFALRAEDADLLPLRLDRC